MNLLESLKEKAKKNPKKIVLPEGQEPRTVKAAAIITKEKLARVTLIGNRAKIEAVAKEQGVDIGAVPSIDPETAKNFEEYAQTYFELRKAKGMTVEEARKIMKDTVFYGTMMVYKGEADGLVSGAEHSTGDTIRPALQTIKTKPGINIVSSSFIMIVPDCEFGDKGMFIFADCAVMPNPNERELAEIAIASAETGRVLCGMDPKVAMLSFSTCGSAKHELVDKVKNAVAIAKEKAPGLKIDGEMQADAAIIPKVGKSKAPNSPIAGQANVLVFPDLQSGNIAYKLVERLAKAQAVGPILQGIAKPVNDLSRGCSVDDIVHLVAITSVQAGGL
ncbi:MAG: phosphate acetyltransferase [Candidatus Aminicenantales bacterium]